MAQSYGTPGTDDMTAPDFESFSTAWLAFSDYFARTANIPSSVAAFETKYAKVDDPSLEQFVMNCDIANECAAALGKSGRTRQGADSILGEVISLASGTKDIAGKYCAMLQQLKVLLSPSAGDEHQRSDKLKQALIDDLVPNLVELKANTLMLDKQIEPLQARLTAANVAISQTTVLNAVNQQIGYLAAKLADRKSKTTVEQQQEYDRLCQFVTDVDNIFALGTSAVLAVGSVRNQVQKVGKLMGDTRSLLMSVCTAANTGQLADYQWVAKALLMPESLVSWSRLNDNAQRFLLREVAK